MNVNDASNYLILGATGAVGSALARRLSERGAHVVVASRNLEALLEKPPRRERSSCASTP